MKHNRFLSNLQQCPLHTTGFRGSTGNVRDIAGDNDTFTRRLAVDQQRKHVGRYKDARIHQDYAMNMRAAGANRALRRHPEKSARTSSQQTRGTATSPAAPNRPQPGGSGGSRPAASSGHRFTEPPSRRRPE